MEYDDKILEQVGTALRYNSKAFDLTLWGPVIGSAIMLKGRTDVLRGRAVVLEVLNLWTGRGISPH